MRVGTVRCRIGVRTGFFARIRTAYQQTILRSALYLAGLLHLRRGRLRQAESCLCRAVMLAPRNFRARVELGRTYFLMEEFLKAEQQFLKAQEIDPGRFQRDHLPGADAEECEACEPATETLLEPPEAEERWLAPPAGSGEAERAGFLDFSSYREWRRLRALPPITRAEIEHTDWDRVFSDPAF